MTSSAAEGGPPLWRHLLSVSLLPFSATVVIPAVLVLAFGTEIGWGLPGALAVLPVLAGGALILLGLRLAYETIALFRSVGRGTLAPWDPTNELVVAGPYRRVRNPMITGVGLVLAGEATVLGSVAVLVELAVFALANALWMPLVEEPGLEPLRRSLPRVQARRPALDSPPRPLEPLTPAWPRHDSAPSSSSGTSCPYASSRGSS
jgi:protein-S-isoprenylcysteine O-methyltransferase Ste14